VESLPIDLQDLSIPVAERVDNPECCGRSEKEGELFVQPPVSILTDVIAVRVHLDDCDELNGALRVGPGSHRLGRLTAAGAMRAREELGETWVIVPRGGVEARIPTGGQITTGRSGSVRGYRTLSLPFYKDIELARYDSYSVAPSGRYALFQDAPTGAVVLFVSANSQRRVVAKFSGSLARDYVWRERQDEATIEFENRASLRISVSAP
jgi:hypothetical protein